MSCSAAPPSIIIILLRTARAATSGLAIRYNDKYIEARYTYITSGSTLSGASILGDEYGLLSAVECNNDKNAQDYLVVKTISNKDFVNHLRKNTTALILIKIIWHSKFRLYPRMKLVMC